MDFESLKPQPPVVTNVTRINLPWRKPATVIEFQGSAREPETFKYSVEIWKDGERTKVKRNGLWLVIAALLLFGICSLILIGLGWWIR